MKKVKWILVVIAMAVLSCTKQENEGEVTYLRINSVSTVQSDDASKLTKAAIQGTSFPTGEKVSVGLFVVGEGYTDAKYRNIEYTKPAGSDTFTDPGIALIQGKTATVYAYYPYDGAISDITQIPVTSSVGGNDWMWATPIENVSTENPSIDLTFHHSLALVEIIFNVFGPAGRSMTNVTVAGGDGAFSATGTMDATDSGKLIPGTAATKSAPFSQDVSLQVSDSKIVADCLLVPGKTGDDADARQDFYIKCTYNGKEYGISLTGSEKGVIVRSKTKSTILLNIKDDKLEVVATDYDIDTSKWW